MHQVNKLFFKQNLAKQFYRNLFRDKPITAALYPLPNRSLLKISGNEAPIFLQGLITNDMQHFEEGANSMYAMFLNNRGRVLYDTLIHKWEGNDSFVVECDKDVSISLQKHLRMFKLKRKVQIEDINEKYRSCALIIPSQVEIDTTIKPNENVNVYKDPRLSDLGYRVIVSSKAVDKDVESITSEKFVVANDDSGYKYLRYKLGVGEGSEDLPIGATFPLEANCDYLHGVSFHKGCYIGQELTARVHHTGVVRKRIMPIKFNNIVEEELERDEVISGGDEKKSNYGKLKTWINDYGLGLVRIKEALEAKSLRIGKLSVEVVKPSWWPIEAPKEKATVKIQE